MVFPYPLNAKLELSSKKRVEPCPDPVKGRAAAGTRRFPGWGVGVKGVDPVDWLGGLGSFEIGN